MGLFSKIKNKVKEVAAMVKNKKNYQRADLSLSSMTVVKGSSTGTQILTDVENLRYKVDIVENNYVKLFDKAFKNKSIEDIIKFVGDDLIKNFASKDERSKISKSIQTANTKRSMRSTSASLLTVDGLQKYMCGGQNLSEADLNAYAQIAAQTQAKARALSFIKANFVPICNMCELDKPEGKNSRDNFNKLMDIVKEYDDDTAEYYVITDFDSEVINGKVVAGASVYEKGALAAQKPCDELLEARLQEESEKMEVLNKSVQDVESIIEDFNNDIKTAAECNKNIQDNQKAVELLEAAIENQEQYIPVIEEALESVREQSKDKSLTAPWVKGRDVKKLTKTRQQEILSALAKVAENIQFFGIEEEVPSNFYMLDEKGRKVNNPTAEDFILFGEGASYDELVDQIAAYQADTDIEEGEKQSTLIVVGKGKDRMVYTDKQIAIMKQIYDKMYQHYIEHDNSLEDFGYVNIRHSIPEDKLNSLEEKLFAEEAHEDFVDLSPAQIKEVDSLIRSNEAVKAFLKKSDATAYELDGQVIDNIAADKKGLLGLVQAYMNRKAIEHNVQVANETIGENTRILDESKAVIEENMQTRKEAFDRSRAAAENLHQVRNTVEEVTPADKAIKSKNPNATKTIRNNLLARIDTLSRRVATASAVSEEEINGKGASKAVALNTEKVKAAIENTTVVLDEEVADFKKSDEARIAAYKKYFTVEDLEKLNGFIKDIEGTVSSVREDEVAL